jgi:hypothetical protein
MSEKIIPSTPIKPEQSVQEVYENYKLAAANKAHWDRIKKPSLRNVVRIALAGAEIERGSASADKNFLKAQRASTQDLEINFEARLQEATHDATASGIVLNLPENPAEVRVASNVQMLDRTHN